MNYASSSSRSGLSGTKGFVASMDSVIGTSSEETKKKRTLKKAKKPSPPSTDEIQGALMRNFSDGVILQDYVKAESSESGKSSFKTTPGSLSLPFKDIGKFCESLLPKGSSPKVLEVCTLIMQKSD